MRARFKTNVRVCAARSSYWVGSGWMFYLCAASALPGFALSIIRAAVNSKWTSTSARKQTSRELERTHTHTWPVSELAGNNTDMRTLLRPALAVLTWRGNIIFPADRIQSIWKCKLAVSEPWRPVVCVRDETHQQTYGSRKVKEKSNKQ